MADREAPQPGGVLEERAVAGRGEGERNPRVLDA
jgi:hypothetical protein